MTNVIDRLEEYIETIGIDGDNYILKPLPQYVIHIDDKKVTSIKKEVGGTKFKIISKNDGNKEIVASHEWQPSNIKIFKLKLFMDIDL